MQSFPFRMQMNTTSSYTVERNTLTPQVGCRGSSKASQWALFSLVLFCGVYLQAKVVVGQSFEALNGDPVPRDVRDLYDRGLQYLVANQDDAGCWPSGHRGAGMAGMGLMCFLASGEDPNFGLSCCSRIPKQAITERVCTTTVSQCSQ